LLPALTPSALIAAQYLAGRGLDTTVNNFNVVNNGTILTDQRTIFEITAPFTNSGKILSSSSRVFSDQSDSLISITNEENAMIIFSGAGSVEFFRFSLTQGTILINNGDIYVTDGARLVPAETIINNGTINIADGTSFCGQGSKIGNFSGPGIQGTECPDDPCLLTLNEIATPSINDDKIYTLNENLTINNCEKLIIRIGFTLIVPIGLTITNIEMGNLDSFVGLEFTGGA
jgi:hypothetical protein